MGTHAQRPQRKSRRKRVWGSAPAQITRQSPAQERVLDLGPPICTRACSVCVCARAPRCGNLWFTENSRNVISSHLLWCGHQRSICTHNAPARAGMHFTVSLFCLPRSDQIAPESEWRRHQIVQLDKTHTHTHTHTHTRRDARTPMRH